MSELNIFIAFGAGLLSFLSPCILPVVPSYFAIIGGESYKGLAASKKLNWFLFFKSLFFVLGFSIIFITLSIVLSGITKLTGGISEIINLVAGGIIIVLGFNFIFDFLKVLNTEKRVHMESIGSNFFSPLLLGMAFGAGWTPCIGPILTSILFLAGTSSTVVQGALLLIFYSLGLGVPFLLGGLLFSAFNKKLVKIRPYLGKIKTASGIFLILMGLLVAFGNLSAINIYFAQFAYFIQEWGVSHPFVSKIISGLIFIIPGILLLIFGLRKIKNQEMDQRNFSVTRIIFICLFTGAALLGFLGIISVPQALSSWFNFQGL
jgi:cytochrome c-type biogenesis protein